MNTEQIVAKIAKMIEILPLDADTHKEISDIINDGLAHYVIDEDDTNNSIVYFSQIIGSAYVLFSQKLEEQVSDTFNYDEALDIITEFKDYLDDFIQNLLLAQIKKTLEATYDVDLSEDEENYIKNDIDATTEETNNESTDYNS